MVSYISFGPVPKRHPIDSLLEEKRTLCALHTDQTSSISLISVYGVDVFAQHSAVKHFRHSEIGDDREDM